LIPWLEFSMLRVALALLLTPLTPNCTYATSGVVGNACNANDLIFESLRARQKVPRGTYAGFDVSGGDIIWYCKGSRRQTLCPDSTRYITVTRRHSGGFEVRCYVSSLKIEDVQAPAKPWAAVAINDSGRWGVSITFEGSTIAVPDALKRCGSGCRIITQGPGQCVAVALSRVGGTSFGHAYGDDRDEVQSSAMSGCERRAPGDTCRLKHITRINKGASMAGRISQRY
jgi:hypothetical protein